MKNIINNIARPLRLDIENQDVRGPKIKKISFRGCKNVK